MLDYKRIKNFFNKHPNGVISIVQVDVCFDLTNDMAFRLDSNSITLFDVYFTRKVYGNEYKRKGDFMIPFQSIIRVEYLTKTENMF